MARNQAYPVELVDNFADAVRQHSPREYTSRSPAATDLMILRALLNHPLIDPAARPATTAGSKAAGSIEPSKSSRSSTH
ncbi:MAG TPA: hypothetical protein VH370_13465 [Humisphaera sp.]|jgi:hypothetical protein|nr:hypothetical protein [Humisphaera sp.]